MTRPRRRTRWSLCVLLANAPALTGCFAASSYQSARMTPPGPSRATFAAGSIGPADENGSDRVTVLDMRVRHNLSPELADMGFTGTMGINNGAAILMVGLEPRVAVVNNYFAVGLPATWFVGVPLGQVSPGVVATLPLSRHLEINAAARLNIVMPAEAQFTYPTFNVGLGVSEDLSRWAIRPEVGFTRLEEEDGWLMQLGVGIEPPAPNPN